VLKGFEQAHQIMGFRDENALRSKHGEYAVNDRVDVRDVSKHIRRGYHAGLSILGNDLVGYLAPEEGDGGGYAALVGHVADLGRLNTMDALAALLPVLQEGPVVGSD